MNIKSTTWLIIAIITIVIWVTPIVLVYHYWHRNDFQETHSQINRDSPIMIERGDDVHLRIKNED